MKGVILACGVSLIYLALITAAFRAAEVRRRARLMALLFFATLPFFAAGHALTPPDLWLLPPAWLEPSGALDLGFGLLVYGTAFFGGILQLYNLADRGFSLRILLDIDDSPAGALTAREVARAYAGGRGIGWMYQKRIQGLEETGLIRISEGTVESSGTGRRVAAIFRALQAFVRLNSES